MALWPWKSSVEEDHHVCPMSHPLCEKDHGQLELSTWWHEPWPRPHALLVSRAVVSHSQPCSGQGPDQPHGRPSEDPWLLLPLPAGCLMWLLLECSLYMLTQTLWSHPAMPSAPRPLSPEHSGHRQGHQPEVWALVSIATPLRGLTGRSGCDDYCWPVCPCLGMTCL